MSAVRGSWLLLLSLLPAVPALSQTCPPVAPVACPNCFAVFIMPDTQGYTNLSSQPSGAAHLDLVTRYICSKRTAWQEPSTGNTMPILMTIHLGDLVDHFDLSEEEAGPLAEWKRVDAAFDNLDACSPVVPYVVTIGNHDIVGFNYEGVSAGYDEYFGTDRWTSRGYGCQDPGDCDWSAGEWFIGGGDPIAANSRNHIGEGRPGPATDQPGRHRAAVIRAPDGRRLLFLGLEMAFDFPPAAPGFAGVEGDDSAWPKRVLSDYRGVPTVVFHHTMFWAFAPPDERLRWGPETWHADSLSVPRDWSDTVVGGMEGLWKEMVEPFPQVFLLVTGHVFSPTIQADYTIPRGGKPPVYGLLRNFQVVADGAGLAYGAGWNAVAVFDPDAGEVRVRSYRIDDEQAYSSPPADFDHDGTPVATECMDTDFAGVGERTIRWDFGASLAARALKAGGASLASLTPAVWIAGAAALLASLVASIAAVLAMLRARG